MGYKSDIEIAQECEMLPITQIAEKAGIDDKYLEQYGKYKAKIDYNLFHVILRGSMFSALPWKMWLSIIAARRLFAAPIAWKSPVK